MADKFIPGMAPSANIGSSGGQSMATPGQIGGQLPWNGGGGSMDYATAYNSALGMNQANYNNILAGYQQTAANQRTGQDAIQGGYNQLYNNVMGGIQGVQASQQQAINDSYAQQMGQQNQQLADRGLGNTTVVSSVDRGLGLDQNKANIALSNQFAQLQAGYQSNLGLAGLNQQNTSNMQNTALANQQLQWMNSVNAQYPDAQAYASIAQQMGAAQQAKDSQNRLNTFQGNPPGGFSSAGSGGGGSGPGFKSLIDWGGGGGGGQSGGGGGTWGPSDRGSFGGGWGGNGSAIGATTLGDVYGAGYGIADSLSDTDMNDNYGFGGYSNWGNDQQPGIGGWGSGSGNVNAFDYSAMGDASFGDAYGNYGGGGDF